MLLSVLFVAIAARAQETPYFITYDHYLEEPSALEIGFNPTYGTQRDGNDFVSGLFEIEYGATAWWTTELYLDAQHTVNDGTVFTGFRWENRFRPTRQEHAVNPILYAEYEHVTGADKVMKEIVGHDVEADHAEPNAEAGEDTESELELKLILSSVGGGWNVSENLIAVKNLEGEPWEFGYAVGVSRPLALAATPEPCVWCAENFVAGLEVYGGLGDTQDFGFESTSHYAAPVLGWSLPKSMMLKFSPTWGLNDDSHRFLFRIGFSREFFLGGRR